MQLNIPICLLKFCSGLLGDVPAKQLLDTYNKFRAKVGQDDELTVGERMLTFQDVVDTMRLVQGRIEQKRSKGRMGALRSRWTRCCLSIKAHETMFSILPEGSEYTSLFVGVLRSVVYVSHAV